MKKLLSISAILLVFLAFGSLGTAQAGNITIHDNMQHAPPDGSPPSPYTYLPSKEDNTVTAGAQTGTAWDMEALYYNNTTGTLDLVGSWDWQNGTSGYKTGDLFIDVDLNAPWGRFCTLPLQATNDYWKYDFVVVFGRVNPGVDDTLNGTYQIFAVPETAAATFDISLTNAPQEAKDYSNPERYVSGGTLVPGSGGNYSWTTYASDAAAQAAGYNVSGWGGGSDTHYVLDVNLAPIATALGIPLDELIFRSHITMSCGNDSLSGYAGPGGEVPVPPSVLLLGSGLLGLGLLGWRRKRD